MLTILITTPAGGDNRIEISDERLLGDGVVLGRARSSGVVLDDISVSRSHARLVVRDGALMVEDVGSSSGTTLNGVRLIPRQPTRLSPNDRVGVGSCTVTLMAPAQAVEPDLPTMIAEPPIGSYLPLAGIDPAALPRWSGGELTVRVVRVVEETHDVKTFAFAAETPTLFHYLPGQFLTLHLTIDGKPVRRSYTISSSPTRPHLLTITVKRIPAAADGQAPGLVSNWLHERVQVGDRITISGPFGDFTCAKHASPRLLLISGGSGITPMLSMARWLTDSGASADTVFLHSARSSRDLIARRELAGLLDHNPHLRVVMITSRPEPGSGWLGITGRLTIEMLGQAVPDYASRRAFCCGPAPFMEGVKGMLAKAGFAMERYHEESFGGAKPAPAPAPGAPTGPAPTPAYGLAAIMRGLNGEKATEKNTEKFVQKPPAKPGGGSSGGRTAVAMLTCTRSKRSVPCSPGTPILEALEGAGISWPSGCRAGMCGMCKVKVGSGAVDRAGYDDSVLSAADRAAGFVLGCVGKPAGAMTIDA